jgi:hypothetical protein
MTVETYQKIHPEWTWTGSLKELFIGVFMIVYSINKINLWCSGWVSLPANMTGLLLDAQGIGL